MAVGIQQIEGQGVNATQLKMELETLRNRVVETVMELNGTRDGLPTFGIDVTELNGTRDGLPTIGNDENIDTPEMPSDFTEIGNNTKRGPP